MLLSSVLSLDRKITRKFPEGCNPIPVNPVKNNLLVLKKRLFLVNLMKNSKKNYDLNGMEKPEELNYQRKTRKMLSEV